MAVGRVCGTSASSAPIVSTSRTPSWLAASTTALANVRQRSDGSTPWRNTRSRSAVGIRAAAVAGGPSACTRKERLTARNGSAYLALDLRDRSGASAARAFREADFLAGQFERGDLVWVRGRVERFRDELQIEVSEIRRAEAELDPAEFLPSAYRNLDELDGFLEHLAREVYDPDYRRLLDSFLGDRVERRGAARRARRDWAAAGGLAVCGVAGLPRCEGAPALPLHPHPPRRGRRACATLRLAGGAGAPPAERARRRCEGRAGAR